MTQEELFESAKKREYVTVIDKFGRESTDRAYVAWVWATSAQVYFLDGMYALTMVDVPHDRILRKPPTIDEKYVNLVE